MKDLEFRAWYDNTDIPNCVDILKTMFSVGDAHGTKHPLDCCKYLKEGQPVVLMQYIGKSDSLGVKLFEGDIVESDYYFPQFKCIAAIQYDTMDNQFGFKFDSGEQDAFRYGNLTVIGNIYENPELLDNNS